MPKLISKKNMDLDIPVHFSSTNIPLKPWKQPEWINQQWNTEKTCSLCHGTRVNAIHDPHTGKVIKKYCLACKGLGIIFVKSANEVITA